jgi:hypothetical protein
MTPHRPIFLLTAIAVTLATLSSRAVAGPITSDQYRDFDRVGPTTVGNPLPQGERPLPSLFGMPGTGTTGPQGMTPVSPDTARPVGASRMDAGRESPAPRETVSEIRSTTMTAPLTPIERPVQPAPVRGSSGVRGE